jgi:hypothetical protein
MREYGVETCECGTCRLMREHPSLPQEWWGRGARNIQHCPGECGNKLGICPKRGTWREPMVPRSSLEWMMEFTSQCPENAEYPDDCPAETGVLGGRECVECWTRAAIKAAEEASGE